MTAHFSSKYESIRNSILKSILDFHRYANSFDTGKRNTIKKIEVQGSTFVIKSFKRPLLINQIAYRYFRKSKAQRSFEYADKLLKLGVNTPTPVAYIENLNFFGLQESFYVSEYIDYDLTFRTLIDEPQYPDHGTIVSAFAEFTLHLHTHGVEFLDHSPGNTLIVKKEGGYDFYLVDLNRMKFGELSYEQRLKNFARLTRKKELVNQLSKAYAKLIDKNPDEVFERMWFYNEQFHKNFDNEKRLKSILFNRKYDLK